MAAMQLRKEIEAMPPEPALATDQQRIEEMNADRVEWDSLGATDAACGRLPKYPNDDYLAGYLRGTKRLPTSQDGTIDRTRPMFEYGHDDEVLRGVDPGDCDWLYGDREEC
jgi:hypothetical protein